MLGGVSYQQLPFSPGSYCAGCDTTLRVGAVEFVKASFRFQSVRAIA